MATFGQAIRRGLPRRPGGEPWPPAGDAPGGAIVGDAPGAAGEAPERGSSGRPLHVEAQHPSDTAAPAPSGGASVGSPADRADSVRPLQESEAPSQQTAAAGAPDPQTATRTLRRGLPRVPGGEPWPPADTTAAAGPAAPAAGASTGAAALAAGIAATAPSPSPRAEAPFPAPTHAPALTTTESPAPSAVGAQDVSDSPVSPAGRAEDTPRTTADRTAGERPLRRGLPRTPGGEAWPPPGLFAAAPAAAAAAASVPSLTEPQDLHTSREEAQMQPRPQAETAPAVPAPAPAGVDYSRPLPFTRTVWEGAAARTRPQPKPEPRRIGPFTRLQWAGAVVVAGGGLLYAGLMAVFAVRWLLSTEWGVGFLAAYPGEYHLPEGAPVGFPAWLGWQHFFNVFLMVLIIRSGLQVRTEKRPSVFWSPRWNGKRKISLNLWFHQSLDILWIVNGVIFVVLLFVTGQWMRIVPTSWEVFPNAISAALQYVSLDWPTENGWVNYNSLQQLAYFATVFIAAPLAIVTGVRMSGIWPKNSPGLNKAYPVEWARAVHFPVMLYFVAFIFVHVVLVFATGALRNLNHMYAAQGSTDPDAYAMNWTGFWIFSVSILIIVAAWIAARPLVLAPIARLFGKVSGR
ncbi:cytochrome b/b6 domain-containing protein [Microbacterium sp.]|uniref:cytochrome b/b6 domain-containing protein n=1 Tax=Microbacterium sp. TaxID=51671 RepID=UPI0035B29034